MTAPILTTPRSGFGGRGYRIPGRKDADGKQLVYPGVTTVLNHVAKTGLHQWIADVTSAFAVTHAGHLLSLEDDISYSRLRFLWSSRAKASLEGEQLRSYYEVVRDDHAELGTNIHEWIEADIDGMTSYPDILAIETEQMIEAWRAWFADHEVISHRTEFTIVNDDLGIAGTGDADWSIRCTHAGVGCFGQPHGEWRRVLVDLKSSRHTWDEHGMQLSALRSGKKIMRQVLPGTEGAMKAEKTQDGKKIVSWWVEDAAPAWDCYALLHIRPDDLDTKGGDMPRFAAIVDLTEDMDVYYEGFVGALAIAKMKHKLRALNKRRGITEMEDE